MNPKASTSAGVWEQLQLTWSQRDRRSQLRILSVFIIAITIWGLTDVRHRARVDPRDENAHKSDLTVYTEAGEAFFDGRDPYKVTNPRGWHYLYPPLFAIAVAPLSLLGTQSQAVIWFFISVLACWGCAVEGMRIARLAADAEHLGLNRQIPKWIAWGTFAVMLVPTLNCLQRGQVGAVLLYFLLLGFRLTIASATWRQAVVGGVVMALPVAIKLTPALPVGVILLELLVLAAVAGWTGKARQRASGAWSGVVAGGVLFLILIPSVAVGPIDNVHHLATWVDRVVVTDDVGDENDFNERSKRNQSLENAIHRLGNWIAYGFFGGPDDRLVEDLENVDLEMPMEHVTVKATTRAVQLLLLVSLLATGWRSARRQDHAAVYAVFALACPLTLLISPLSWVHHYMMWLPALIVVPYLQWARGFTRTAQAMLISAATLVWAHYVVMDWTGRMGLLGLGTTVWFIAGCSWIFRNSRAEAKHAQADQPVHRSYLRAA